MKAFVGFAGFGGVDLVLREAGFSVLGVENDPEIAEVNRLNGGDVITSDILDLNPGDFSGEWTVAHFSPPCPNFSIAKAGSVESNIDIALACWIGEFVALTQPEYFTLENVWAYRKSQSWAIILKALRGLGYGVEWWHLNAANYGVPQTRKRMIAIGRRDGRHPTQPVQTHQKRTGNGQLSMFEALPAWCGWHEAIEDLLPGLEPTQPAAWQVKAFPDELKPFLLPVNGEGSTYFTEDAPSQTITSGHTGQKYRAFIIDSQNASHNPITNRADNEPAFTVVSTSLRRPSTQPKAFIIGGQYQTPNYGSQRIVQNKPGDNPIWTITASENGDMRSYVAGHWVSMNERCLARFQDFPDSFKLPDSRVLACRGIGNAVPPGLYRAVINSLSIS